MDAENKHQLLIALLSNEQLCMDLLLALDTVARHESSFEYGLPLHSDAAQAALREAIYKWAKDAI